MYYDSHYIDAFQNAQTGEITFSLASDERYLPYTKITVMYEIPGVAVERVSRKLSRYFVYKLYHDLRTGDARDPVEVRRILDDCCVCLAKMDATFKYCHLGEVIVKECRL